MDGRTDGGVQRARTVQKVTQVQFQKQVIQKILIQLIIPSLRNLSGPFSHSRTFMGTRTVLRRRTTISDQENLENFKSEYDGAWKLTDKGENFDQYLADNGVNWFARMVASWMHPIFTFRHTSEKFSFFTNSNTAKISILIPFCNNTLAN